MSPTGAQVIRAKKLGVLIRDTRQFQGKSLEECAAMLNVSNETFESYELGEKSPSLPEVEFLAYYLEIPLEHFWGEQTLLSEGGSKPSLDVKRLTAVRQRMIGVLLRKARFEKGFSIDELAEKTNIPVTDLEMYELGQAQIGVPQLELLCGALGRDLRDFQDRYGPIGVWFIEQRAMRDFKEMPPEMQAFVAKPINLPYLELAQRLSEMSVDKLRAVAEGLLEITL